MQKMGNKETKVWLEYKSLDILVKLGYHGVNEVIKALQLLVPLCIELYIISYVLYAV